MAKLSGQFSVLYKKMNLLTRRKKNGLLVIILLK